MRGHKHSCFKAPFSSINKNLMSLEFEYIGKFEAIIETALS
jgi:hypothetical protein